MHTVVTEYLFHLEESQVHVLALPRTVIDTGPVTYSQ